MEGFDTTNLERSERVIAAIVLRLAETGFQRSTASFEDLSLPADLEVHFDHSATWLIDEAIMRVSDFARHNGGAGKLFNPVLTSHGLSLLGQRIVIRGTQGSASNAVSAIAKGDRSFWQVGDFIGSIVGGFTKSLGG